MKLCFSGDFLSTTEALETMRVHAALRASIENICLGNNFLQVGNFVAPAQILSRVDVSVIGEAGHTLIPTMEVLVHSTGSNIW